MHRMVDDEEIVGFFFARNEKGLALIERRHGARIFAICRGILGSAEDARECCNSVWFTAWNRIPPDKPRSLAAYLSKIARDLAIDKLRENAAQKRGGAAAALPYEELEEVIGDRGDVCVQIETKELTNILNHFLEELPSDRRRLFMLRYYSEKSVAELSKLTGLSKQGVYYILNELKKQLKEILEKEGYVL